MKVKKQISQDLKISKLPDYDSNPFTLAFNSFTQFFKTNVAWAVAFLVIAFFGAIGQFAGNIIDIASTSQTNNSGIRSSIDDTNTANGYFNKSEEDFFDTFNGTNSGTEHTGAIILIVVGLAILIMLFAGVAIGIGTFVTGMFTYVALQSGQGKTVEFAEAWRVTVKRFWRLLGAQMLAGLKIFAWTLLLIVPGIIAALRYTLLPYVVMSTADEEKGIIATHNTTKLLVKGRLMEVFGLATVAAIVPFVGSLLKLTGNEALYRQLKAYNDSKTEKPKIHWLNYLGLLLIAAGIMLALLIAGFVLLIVLAGN